jgi:hypothetical protein
LSSGDILPCPAPVGIDRNQWPAFPGTSQNSPDEPSSVQSIVEEPTRTKQRLRPSPHHIRWQSEMRMLRPDRLRRRPVPMTDCNTRPIGPSQVQSRDQIEDRSQDATVLLDFPPGRRPGNTPEHGFGLAVHPARIREVSQVVSFPTNGPNRPRVCSSGGSRTSRTAIE